MNAESQTTNPNFTAAGNDMANEVERRLAEIAAAMSAKLSESIATRTISDGQACPIDPAERALCEGCQ
jgi:hypothetical protein